MTSQLLLKPSDNCWRVERADEFAILIDADIYFAAARAAMKSAKRSIFLVGWDVPLANVVHLFGIQSRPPFRFTRVKTTSLLLNAENAAVVLAEFLPKFIRCGDNEEEVPEQPEKPALSDDFVFVVLAGQAFAKVPQRGPFVADFGKPTFDEFLEIEHAVVAEGIRLFWQLDLQRSE